ncbi:MAG: glycosyltransferase [Candidatus Fermentibacteraceae bacterium]|nr:glycosyltransferase [Candidatus Fermentibacteraceae bacterium]MBN2608709.1 glycosyltransferase [Candidatus Fermentibacteraceae bacterium]
MLIPTYNEALNVGPLYNSIREQCDFHLMFIDDGSPDGTALKIEELARKDKRVLLLRRGRKEGLGNAYRDAFRRVREEGGWDRIFMMDADLSHQPVHLSAIDDALEDHVLVLGSRYIQGVSVLNWSILRLNLSYSANKYIRLLTGMPFSDCTSGFRGFHSSLIPVLLSSTSNASGYAFLVETLFDAWKAGADVGEVPIVFVERRMGSSKVSPGVFMESLLTPLKLRLRSLFRT